MCGLCNAAIDLYRLFIFKLLSTAPAFSVVHVHNVPRRGDSPEVQTRCVRGPLGEGDRSPSASLIALICGEPS
ncbi:unnamed protein product [Leptosia nina]|uniref:Secreted protein n=1 Tax=Leptosia nina TaxID=320188 RepID=A0AAV1IY01_9NEOP